MVAAHELFNFADPVTARSPRWCSGGDAHAASLANQRSWSVEEGLLGSEQGFVVPGQSTTAAQRRPTTSIVVRRHY
jgi:hypothetical protein